MKRDWLAKYLTILWIALMVTVVVGLMIYQLADHGSL